MSFSSQGVEFPVAGYISPKAAAPLRCYILMSADIRILPVQAVPRPPTELTDFRHTTSLKLTRMSEKDAEERQATHANSCSLGTLVYDMVREEVGYNNCALRVFGCLRKTDEFRGSNQWIILVASSTSERDQWLAVLYFLLAPWSVLKRTMQDQITSAAQRSVSSTSAVPTGAMLSLTISASQSTKKNEEDLLAAISRGAEGLVEFAGSGNKVWSWTASTATNLAGIVRTAQALEEITIPLKAISLVGPAFLCFAVVARSVACLASEKVHEKRLPAVHTYLRALMLDIAEVLIALVESECRDAGLLSSVFEVFETCWEVGTDLERYLLARYPNRLFGQKKALAIVTQVDALRDKMLGVGILRHVISHTSIIGELQNEIITLKESIRHLGEEMAKDEFVPSFATIPALPLHVLQDATPQISELRTIILTHAHQRAQKGAGLLVSLQGESGIGKTTACILVGKEDAIRREYPDGIYFISLGPTFDDQKALASIAEIVHISGGKKRAIEISNVPHGPEQVQFAVNLAKHWFQGLRALLILDNVFPRAGSGVDSENEWVPILSSAFSDPEAGCIFSTRMQHLAEFALHKLVLQPIDMKSDTGRSAAIRIFESYADIETHRKSKDPRFEFTNSNYCDSREYILSVCSGVPLAIVMAAIYVKRRKYCWEKITPGLRSRVLGSAGSIGVRAGLKAIMEESLAFVDQLSQTVAADELFDDLDVTLFSSRHGANWFTITYASLAVFDSSQEVLIPVLALHLGVDEEQADGFARLCEGMALGKYDPEHRLRQEDASVMCISLHDLQLAVAEGICGSRSGLASIRYHHRSLLSACAERLGEGLGRESAINWSRLFALDAEKLVWPVYVATNLSRHLLACVKALPRNIEVIDEQLQSADADVYWADCFRAFFTDYRWIQDCSQVLGRMATTILMESPILQRDKSESYLIRKGEMEGINMICEVLKSIRSEDFSRKEACVLHGVVDGGLAGQLYGRIEVLQFKALDREERESALLLIKSLQKSIVKYAQRPWLRPINACYSSAEEKDPKCLEERLGGDGIVYAVVPFKFKGRSFAASACRSGIIRIHDLDNTKGFSPMFRAHNNVLNGLACAPKGFQGDLLLASSSLDGTIKIWRLCEIPRSKSSELSPKDISLLGSLRGQDNEMFTHVAITPDCNRIVAGCRTRPGDYSHDLFLVYVFARRIESGDDAVCFEVQRMWVHTDYIRGVKISSDGRTVASASGDGTVQILSPKGESTSSSMWTIQGHGEINCVELTRDGRYLCCGTSKNLFLFDVAARRLVRSLLHPTAFLFSPPVVSMSIADDPSDGTFNNYRIFTGHLEGSITERPFFGNEPARTINHTRSRSYGYVYCLSTEHVECGSGSEVAGSRKQERSVAWRILSGHGDGHVRVWTHEKIVEGTERRLESEFREGTRASDRSSEPPVPQGLVTSVAWTRNGKTLACGFAHGFRTWNAELGTLSSVTAPENRDVYPSCIDFSNDGHFLVAGEAGGQVSLWQSDGNTKLQVLQGHNAEVTVVIFSWSNKHVVSGDSGGECRVWDMDTFQCVHSKSRTDNTPVISLSVGRALTDVDVDSSRGQSEIVCSCRESGQIEVWKMLSGETMVFVILDLTPRLARPSVRFLLMQEHMPACVKNAKWRESSRARTNRDEARQYELDGLKGVDGNITIRNNKMFPSKLDVLFVDPFGKPLCECAASIQFDSQPSNSGMFAFNQEHAGTMRTIVGCTLAFSDVTAFMELMWKN